MLGASVLQKKNEESESKRKKEVNLVISHAPSADNSNLSADGDDSFISVEMDSAMPSPFSEVRPRRGGFYLFIFFFFKKAKAEDKTYCFNFEGKNRKLNSVFWKRKKFKVMIECNCHWLVGHTSVTPVVVCSNDHSPHFFSHVFSQASYCIANVANVSASIFDKGRDKPPPANETLVEECH